MTLARPDARVAFGFRALDCAMRARTAGPWSIGAAEAQLLAPLREKLEALSAPDRALATEAFAAFARRVVSEPEEAGCALRDFILDWSHGRE